jgi:putative PIN family toxin of toxin-antitoxin system
LDTNTVVSGLLWKGIEHGLLTEIGGRTDIALYASPKLLAELADVLSRNKLARAVAASGLSPDQSMSRYLEVVRVVTPTDVPPVILADPDDDHVLACALAARVDLIVSGDPHLLNLNSYQGIPIVGTREALERIAKGATTGPTQPAQPVPDIPGTG